MAVKDGPGPGPDIVVDVETIGPAWDEIDEPTREYLAKRAYRDEWERFDAVEKAAIIRDGGAAAERLALEFGLAEIIAIGLWMPGVDRGHALIRVAPDHVPEEIRHRCSLGPYVITTEEILLGDFWNLIRKGRIVTYNGRSFDGPMLMIRSAQLGVRPSRNLVPYRYDLSEHCDLADVLTFYGSCRGLYALDYWCRRFGLESPKAGGVTGATVGDLWRAGKYEAVAEYVLGDVRAEAELWKRLAGVACHFKGGPPEPGRAGT